MQYYPTPARSSSTSTVNSQPDHLVPNNTVAANGTIPFSYNLSHPYLNPNPTPQVTGAAHPPSIHYTTHSAQSLTTQQQVNQVINATTRKRGRPIPKTPKPTTPSPRKKQTPPSGLSNVIIPLPLVGLNHAYYHSPTTMLNTGFIHSPFSPISTPAAAPTNYQSPPSVSAPAPLQLSNYTPLRPTASIPVPPLWQDHLNEAHSALETYKTFPVTPGSLEYVTLSNLCSSLQVSSIEQILNPELWTRFSNARKEMFRSKSEDLSLLSKLGVEEKEILRAAQMSFNWKQHSSLEPFPYSDNLALLFHCTRNAANLASILSQGLDERLSSGGATGAGGLLGRGIYFADNPLKSIAYDGGTGIIFLCAVLLGDCLAVDHLPNRASFVREPEKGKDQKRNFNDSFYDSIVGRPGGPNNEYVIYNRYQCVPMYQIKYQRTGARPTAGNSIHARQQKSLPPIAFTPQGTGLVAPSAQGLSQGWAFHASTVFAQMGIILDEVVMADGYAGVAVSAQMKEDEAAADLLHKLDTLNSLGFWDEEKNKITLKKYGNDLDRAVNFLLDEDNSQSSQGTAQTASSSSATGAVSASATSASTSSAAGASTSSSTSATTKPTILIQLTDDEEDSSSPKDELLPKQKATEINKSLPSNSQDPSQIKANIKADLRNYIQDFDFDSLLPKPASQTKPVPTLNLNLSAFTASTSTATKLAPKFPDPAAADLDFHDWLLDFDLSSLHSTPVLPLDPSPTVSLSSAFAPLSKEECPICCEEFDYDASNPTNPINSGSWAVLSCSHKVCNVCHAQIVKVRDTMSGVSHTSTKCPFCGGNSGTEIGTCPTGIMRVVESPGSCSGYEGYSTWAVNYSVASGGYSLSRTAYIPNTTEGRRILGLLKTAWDRRLVFTIGTSNTTGVENTLVWNIHHKTAVSGGVTSHGYPDSGYLERVGWELKAFGIE